MTWGTLAEIAAVVVALPTIVAAGLWLRKRWRRIEQFLGDWNGEPDRPGVPGRLGVMPRLKCLDDRMAAVEKELHPNSGHTVKDQLNRVEEALGTGGPPD